MDLLLLLEIRKVDQRESKSLLKRNKFPLTLLVIISNYLFIGSVVIITIQFYSIFLYNRGKKIIIDKMERYIFKIRTHILIKGNIKRQGNLFNFPIALIKKM